VLVQEVESEREGKGTSKNGVILHLVHATQKNDHQEVEVIEEGDDEMGERQNGTLLFKLNGKRVLLEW